MTHPETADWIEREAGERLHPRMTNPNWLILRARRKLFTEWLARIEGTSLRILDVGGRIQPYRKLLKDRTREYYAVDLVQGPGVRVVGSAEDLPLASNQFDLVFCTQMLEYVPRPQRALDEIHRVLRPSGCLLLSAPAVFPRDADQEYWRFLAPSLRLLLRNFTHVEVAAEGSTISGLFRTLNVSLLSFSPRWIQAGLRYTATPLLNGLGLTLEKVVHTRNEQFTANFSAFARK